MEPSDSLQSHSKPEKPLEESKKNSGERPPNVIALNALPYYYKLSSGEIGSAKDGAKIPDTKSPTIEPENSQAKVGDEKECNKQKSLQSNSTSGKQSKKKGKNVKKVVSKLGRENFLDNEDPELTEEEKIGQPKVNTEKEENMEKCLPSTSKSAKETERKIKKLYVSQSPLTTKESVMFLASLPTDVLQKAITNIRKEILRDKEVVAPTQEEKMSHPKGRVKKEEKKEKSLQSKSGEQPEETANNLNVKAPPLITKESIAILNTIPPKVLQQVVAKIRREIFPQKKQVKKIPPPKVEAKKEEKKLKCLQPTPTFGEKSRRMNPHRMFTQTAPPEFVRQIEAKMRRGEIALQVNVPLKGPASWKIIKIDNRLPLTELRKVIPLLINARYCAIVDRKDAHEILELLINCKKLEILEIINCQGSSDIETVYGYYLWEICRLCPRMRGICFDKVMNVPIRHDMAIGDFYNYVRSAQKNDIYYKALDGGPVTFLRHK